MHFVDRLFLLRHSSTEMAAALPSGNLLWTIMALPIGIASYVNTFVAQYHGAQEPRRIGPVVNQALRFAWWTVPGFILLIPLAGPLFAGLGHSDEFARLEARYFEVNCLGAGAAVLSAAYAGFYTGRGCPGTVMWIDLLACLLNVVGDWVLIFGVGGFPEWGIAGAAAATAASQWVKVLLYAILLRDPAARRDYALDIAGWDRPLFRSLLRFGVPNGIQMVLEGLAFTVFLIAIGRFGTIPAAATTLAISINIVAFVPMIGVGIAVSTLVGNYLGANRPELARRAAWSGLGLALAYNGVFALCYLFTPHLFLWLHSSVTSSSDFVAIRDLAVDLLRFVAAYCLFDAAQLTFCSAIKGAGDTRFVLITTFATSGGAVLVGQCGVWWFEGATLWWWTVLMGWIISLAIAYSARFYQGTWQQLRVID